MNVVQMKDLYEWCKIPADNLVGHPGLRVPFRMVADSSEMGELMAREFVDAIKAANYEGKVFRAIVPCGPKAWYEPFTQLVNAEKVSLRNLVVFHMDECLDWQGNLLARNDPYNFRTFMESHFYGGIAPELAVPPDQRIFPEPARIEEIKSLIAEAPIDLTLGGFGQDGHIAYNQTRRHPFSHITIEQLRNSELRVQENNLDTIISLGQRSYGGGYQFVPPMSITLGLKECLSAKKVRLFSDTGAWKQTALRVALFSPETTDYPITLLQSHPDALVTATFETARHPIAENPEWAFKGIHV
jgi:glucosamine-6-phosphate deaminase